MIYGSLNGIPELERIDDTVGWKAPRAEQRYPLASAESAARAAVQLEPHSAPARSAVHAPKQRLRLICGRLIRHAEVLKRGQGTLDVLAGLQRKRVDPTAGHVK